MSKLKACPFCGGKATYRPGSGVDLMTQNNNPYIGCAECHFCISAETYTDLRGLIEKWNRRAERKEVTDDTK